MQPKRNQKYNVIDYRHWRIPYHFFVECIAGSSPSNSLRPLFCICASWRRINTDSTVSFHSTIHYAWNPMPNVAFYLKPGCSVQGYSLGGKEVITISTAPAICIKPRNNIFRLSSDCHHCNAYIAGLNILNQYGLYSVKILAFYSYFFFW